MRRFRPLHRTPLIVLAATIVAGLGFVAGHRGVVTLTAGDDVVAPDATTPYVACPGDITVGYLHRNDRVFLTGRDQKAGWLEIRDPQDVSTRVWIAARAVRADGDPTGLPVHDCAKLVALDQQGAPPTPTAAPTAAGTPVSTTSTPTHAPTPTPAPTHAAPDTVPPSISAWGVSVAHIWGSVGPPECGPITTDVSAVVTDDTHVASVTLHWSISGTSVGATQAMTFSGGRYSATIGPITNSKVPVTSTGSTIVWSVTAVDAAGNSSGPITAPAASDITITYCLG